MATNMEFNKAKALAVSKKPTDNIGLPFELNLEAYIK